MKVVHDPTLPLAGGSDDSVDDRDQRPVDGIDQFENRLSVVIAEDSVLVLENDDIAAV